jgi:hypothetical protein
LLLDGFDEMGARSDPALRKTNYLKLAPLIEAHSKVLLSCRPAYFVSLEETQTLFSFVTRQVGFAPPLRAGDVSEHLYHAVEEIALKPAFSQVRSALTSTVYGHLNLFDFKQIRAYLRKHNDSIRRDSEGQLDSKSLMKRIQEIYDLEDLAQRPILLKLIVSTLPLFRKDDAGNYNITISNSTKSVPDITPSVLYEVYTEKELEREYLKGQIRWLIERTQKVKVIAVLAFEMFRSDALAADRQMLATVILQSFPNDESEQAFYITDIRTCNFLSRDHQDAVRFTHKSFMEYFAAVYLRLAMKNSEAAQGLLSMRSFPDEVSYFLGDSIAASPDAEIVRTILNETFNRLQRIPSPSQICLENIVNVMNYSRRPLPAVKNIRASTLVYRKLRVAQISFDGVSCEALKIIKTEIRTLEAKGCDLKKVECESSRIERVQFNEDTVRSLRVWDSRFEKMIIGGGHIVVETMRRAEIREAHWRGAVVSGGGETLGSAWAPMAGRIEGCTLVNLKLTSEILQRVEFGSCTFVMCRAEVSLDDLSKLDKCRGVLIGKQEEVERGGIDSTVALWSAAGINRRVRKQSALPGWNELLLRAFAANLSADGQKFPRGASEIRARIRQVDSASRLMRRKGSVLMLEGSSFDHDGECRLLECTEQEARLFNLKTQAKFTEMLRRLTVEESELGLKVTAGSVADRPE